MENRFKFRCLIILIILFYQFNNIFSQISIKLLNEDGELLDRNNIYVNNPFFIEVDIINKNVHNPDKLDIKGLNQFKVLENKISEEYIINNFDKKRIIKIFFKIFPEKIGNFVLGPLKIDDLESNILNIKVEEDNRVEKDCTFDLIVSKKNWYVGQKIPFILRFKTDKDNVNLLEVEEPEAKNFKVLNFSKPHIYDKKDLNDKPFHIVDYSGFFLMNSSGTFKINPLKSVYSYTKLSEKKHKLFKYYSGFKTILKREAYSKAIDINVKNLPKNDKYKDVKAIGNFTDIEISIDKKVANINDLLTLNLKLKTDNIFDSNIDLIDPPSLNLPKSMRYYISKNSINILENNKAERIFEYIIHPLEPGEFKISKQQLIFFNTNKNSYDKIESKQDIYLKIVGDLKKNEDTLNNNFDGNLNQPINLPVVSDLDKDILDLSNNIKQYKDISLSLNIFIINIIIVLILLLIIIFLNNKDIIIILFKKIARPFTWYIAIIKILFYKIINKKDKLYNVFKTAFSNMFNISLDDIDDRKIINYLKNEKNLDINSWILFNNRLLMYAGFYKIDFDQKKYDIFKESLNWIKKLRKIKYKKLSLNIFLILLVNYTLFSNNVNPYKNSNNNILNYIIKLEELKKDAYANDYKKINNIIKELRIENNLKNSEDKLSYIIDQYYIYITYINEFIWGILFIVVIYIILILFYFKFNIIYKLLAILFFIISSFNYFLIYKNKNDVLAISLLDNNPVYIGPDNIYPIKGYLSLAEKTKVKKFYHKDWVYINNPYIKGWVKKDTLKVY